MEIERFDDLIRALREHPAWLEELRAIILTETLLTLPDRLAAVERELRELNERQGRFEQRQEGFEQRQGRFEQRQEGFEQRQEGFEQRQEGFEQRQGRFEQRQEGFAERQESFAGQLGELNQRQERMDQRLARLEGEAVERRYRQHGPGYFGRMARRVRLMSRADRDTLLDGLEDAGTLSAEEADEIRRADGVFTARRDGEAVYLLMEASTTIAVYDVERAVDRAALLARTGTRVLPIVAGVQIPDHLLDRAAQDGVWVVTNGTVAAPAA